MHGLPAGAADVPPSSSSSGSGSCLGVVDDVAIDVVIAMGPRRGPWESHALAEVHVSCFSSLPAMSSCYHARIVGEPPACGAGSGSTEAAAAASPAVLLALSCHKTAT